ncbi:mitochondrial inner-membrane-bound regulator-domain-containing protein [Coniella lustricola]|uniref:Mitochondrial inner-membrane-bound regulator-domain-containing protein n=1 Tax=Coniella lustricola TaxID=2025994 RepID=A0A2T3A154_9PEZI|nr:mitochondrial inner-membrane-bound regulator-domain-containing protein [Coniella lustricola]
MFATSVAGGSICIGCQLRAVTRRATPAVAATVQARAHNRIRRRRYASEATRAQEDQFAALLRQQAHVDESEPRRPSKSARKKQRKRGLPQHDDDGGEEDPFPLMEVERKPENEASTNDAMAASEGEPSQPGLEAERKVDDEMHVIEPVAASEDDIPFELERSSTSSKEPANTTSDHAEAYLATATTTASADHATENSLQGLEATPVLIKRIQSRQAVDPDKLNVQRHVFGRPLNSRKPPPPEGEGPFRLGRVSGPNPKEADGPVKGFAIRRLVDGEEIRPQPEAPVKHKKRYVAVRKGRALLVEHNARLDVDTLGQPAEIIVLREREGFAWKDYKADDVEVAPSLRVEEHIGQEEGLDMDIILENIDGVRPVHRILPTSDFRQVFDTLMNGFKVAQLASYVDRFHSRVAEGEESPLLGPSAEASNPRAWIVERSEWIPEVKGAVRDVESHLRGYILKSMPPKQRLTIQLMRECWGLVAQELMDREGYVEVKVRDLEWNLLTAGTQRWFQSISRVLLRDGAGKSMQLIKSRKVIRIEAPKVVAEACIEAIDDKLQNIRSKTFKMNELPIDQVSPGMVEDLSRITNSVVQYHNKKKTVTITWIEIDKHRPSNLEDLGDIVFRLLLSAYPPSRTSKTLSVYPDVEGKGQLLEDIGSQDKLSWIDRRNKWARLCLPVSKASQTTPRRQLDESMIKYKIDVTPEDLTLRQSSYKAKIDNFYKSLQETTSSSPLAMPWTQSRLGEEVQEVQEQQQPEQEPDDVPQPTQPTSSGWLPFSVRTSATFGHVLHLNNSSVAQSFHEGTSSLDTADFPRAFSPLIPAVAGMHLPAWVPYHSPRNMTTIIVMRFVPYSQNPETSNDPLAPHLELRLKATDEAIIGIDSLRAIAHTDTSDILLPAEHVDVRLTQRVVAQLPGHEVGVSESMAPLRDFLNSSRLDMGRGSLTTPPRLDNLGLPLWMFYRPEADAEGGFLASAARRQALQNQTMAQDSQAKTTVAHDGTQHAESPTSTPTTIPTAAKPPPLSTIFSEEIIRQAKASSDGKDTDNDNNNKNNNTVMVNNYDTAIRSPAFNTTFSTSYMFAGIELHRPTETTYSGWKLNYTSIQAGQGGGRRAELRLDAVPSGDEHARRRKDDMDTRRFMRSVYMLATGDKDEAGRKKSLHHINYNKSWIRWVGMNHTGWD